MNGLQKKSEKYVVFSNTEIYKNYIKDKEGNIILGPISHWNDIYFLEGRDIAVFKMFLRGNNECHYEVVCLDRSKQTFSAHCSNIIVLDNKNLILEGVNNTDRTCIYDTVNGKISSGYFDYVGNFTYSEDGKNYYGPARYDIHMDGPNGGYNFYFVGKINGNGQFISPIFNSATEETFVINKDSDFTLADEIEKTEEHIKKKMLERKNKINNLPIIEPYDLV